MSSREFSGPGAQYTAVLIAGAVLCTVGAGALVVYYPTLAVLAGGAIAALSFLLVFYNRLPTVFFWSLGIVLVGYAFLNRGFAYVGVPPLFVGELVLVLAAVVIVIQLRNARFGILESLLCAFIAWGLFRTVPYVGVHGVDALRDAVVWGYAIFALAIAFSVQKHHLETIAKWYAKLIPLFLLWVPVAFSILFMFSGFVPSLPGSGEPLLVVKAGDFGVHLAGIASFILLGALAYYARPDAVRELLLWPLWLTGALLAGAINRGGLLAMSVGVSVAFMLRPSSRVLTLLFGGALIIVSFALVDPTVGFGHREFSTDQVVTNVKSIFARTDAGGLESTREWRLQWWSDIVDYTVRGPYFWTGKGFGINIAADDGYQGMMFEDNRSPHNGHMTILARTGVPGFVWWIVMQVAFALSLIVAFFRACQRGDTFWWQISAWLFVYWLAMIINMSFDVYLEGPQGGIWFWTIFGLGLAVIRIQAEDRNTSEKDHERGAVDGQSRVVMTPHSRSRDADA